MTTRWNPQQYLKFSDHRIRPALDLMQRIPNGEPETVCDLGCGPGNVTRLLKERWPGASITGVDSSPDMLARARQDHFGIDWQEADIATWSPGKPADVIFSNAALHWLDNHQSLFPRLLSFLKPGGALAVQMPRNHGAPSHRLRNDVARSGPWAELLSPLLRDTPVADPDFYYDLLAPDNASIDIWESEYTHALEGDAPVLEWVRGTALKPLLNALDGAENPDWMAAFIEEYKGRLNAAYPRRADGRTLFAFRRLFIVAVK